VKKTVPAAAGEVHDDGTAVFRDRCLWHVAGVGADAVGCVNLGSAMKAAHQTNGAGTPNTASAGFVAESCKTPLTMWNGHQSVTRVAVTPVSVKLLCSYWPNFGARSAAAFH
jgi:hypothetical protein